MAYPTTAALVAASSVPELTSLNSAQQDALRASSIAAIEEYTGQRFEPYTETKRVDGSGTAEIFLPARLESFTAVSVSGIAVPVADLYVEPTNLDRLAWTGAIGSNYYSRALADVDPATLHTFPYEAGSVEITGTWGWTNTPQNVITAIRYDMEDQARADANTLSSTMQVFRKLGMRDISQGNLRATMTQSPPTVTPRAASLLDGFLWMGGIGRVI